LNEFKVDNLLNKIHLADALELMKHLPSNSIDLVLTDPPYFLDKLDNNWNSDTLEKVTNASVVKSLPSGMKFSKQQGVNFYLWFREISSELLRILKPGGFFFSFSSPRLYHRLVSAIDDVGFWIRDCFVWIYPHSQPKAMSLNHFLDKLEIPKQKKVELSKELINWKTPQIKSCFEPIVMAQKPTEGTFLENFVKYRTGLVNTSIKLGNNLFPANVVKSEQSDEYIDNYFLLPKPKITEKGDFNKHKTVKPLQLCEYLIKLTTYDEQSIVFDPFAGSGTTLLAAKINNRQFIGCDINKEYIEIAKKRLNF